MICVFAIATVWATSSQAKCLFICHHRCQRRKSKVHVCRRQWSLSSWPCHEEAPFLKTLVTSYLFPSPTMPDVNHNLKNQNMFQCDVAVVRRRSLRLTWPRNNTWWHGRRNFESQAGLWKTVLIYILKFNDQSSPLMSASNCCDRTVGETVPWHGARTIPACLLWKECITIHNIFELSFILIHPLSLTVNCFVTFSNYCWLTWHISYIA